MKATWKNTAALLVGVLLGLALAAGAALIAAGGPANLRAALKTTMVMRVIQREYVAGYEPEDVTDAAMAGAVESLDDWSYYMDAESYLSYQDYAANRYQGIGVTVTTDEATGGFFVSTLTKDGPAQIAGIVAGDVILAVDGTDVTGRDTAYLRSLIQADFGKTAEVTVLHADGSREAFSVSCEEIYTTPVSSRMLPGDVGYVVIRNFRQGAGADASAAVRELEEQGARALVLDVRSNPGGQVSELEEILDCLLPQGDIFIRADRNGSELVETSDPDCVELPMAVIVNRDSYSAAEYFAAALREYDWALVVGEHTTGKARSQITVELPDGSAVHISKYTYLTPHRQDLYEAGGVMPDVAAELAEEERTAYDTGWLEPEDDPQVQAALQAVGEMISGSAAG